MPNKNIRRGPAAGGAPADFVNRQVANDIYVDGLTGNVLIGTGTSGTSSKPLLTGIDAPASPTLSANTTLAPATHAGKVLVTSGTAGFTVTLPAATGSGAWYRIFIGTTMTSSSFVLQVGNANDYFRGQISTVGGSGITVAITANTGTLATESDTLTWNRSTTGLATQGDYVEVLDIAANVWSIYAEYASSGAAATPFSAAV